MIKSAYHIDLMAENQRNYTPISLSGARPRGSFFGAHGPKNVLAVGGMLAMVVLVGIGAIALRNTQTLTTPAQTPIVGSSCPEGYKQLSGVIATSPADVSTLCPGGDIVIFDGPTESTVSKNTSSGAVGTTDGGIGSTVDSTIIGNSGGDGDTSRSTPTRIVCCRPPSNSPTATPVPVVTVPKEDTSDACVIPELDIQKVTLECPNCGS